MKRKIFIFLILAYLAFFSCDLFKPGLGNAVDIEKPVLSIVSPQNGEYVSGVVTISGTYTEDTGVSSIALSLDGGANFLEAGINTSNKTWQYQLDTTLYPDGEQDIIVRIVDIEDKALESNLLLRIDNTPPMLLIKNPQYYATSVFNGDINLRGEATDTFGILSVEVEFSDTSGTLFNLGGASAAAALSAGILQPDIEGIPSRYAVRDLKKSLLSSKALADGTNSWSFLFESKDYITVSGDYYFLITARDYANNVSSVMYHYNDVLDRNSQQAITIESLYKILRGFPLTDPDVVITQADLLAIELEELPLSINQTLDLPEFIISNPDMTSLPEENILPGNAKALGMVTDDDGVNPSTIRICIDPADGMDPDGAGNVWTSVDEVSGSGLSVNWKHDLSSLPDGAHQLWIRASDIYANSGVSNIVGFSIDRGAPSITVTSPSQGDYINSDFTITGTATDGDAVASVEVSLNNGVDYEYADLSGEDWTYDVEVTGDDVLNIKVRATDSTAKEAYFNLLVITDISLPVVTILSPQNTSTVNGEVIFKGTANDGNQMDGVELKIGKPETWIMLDDIYNWDYTIDSNSYANDTYADDLGGEVWQLYVQARATDIAGNTGVSAGYYILIDNDMDKPTINIISPSEGKNIGGPVLITGTAFDDDMVHSVRMKIDINGDGDFNDQIDLYNGVSSTKDGDTNDKFENETLWYLADGTTLWTENINKFGELYETEPGHTGNITIRVWAVDTKDGINPDVEGNYQELHITLDDTIPRIENLNLESGDYVKGEFILTGDALDDQYVDQILISYNGGTSYTDIISNPSHVTRNFDNDYSLHITIDSESYIPTSGIFYLRLKVIDNANYQTISYINLNVDNVYPTGAWDTGSVDPQEIDGSDALVQGTAQDSGTVSGFGKTCVYFIRGGALLNPKGLAPGALGTEDFDDGSTPAIVDVTPFDYPALEADMIIIDDTNEFGNDSGGNGDGDGYDEGITLSGSEYTWYAEFNSNNIPDGAVDIHYVVFDPSGNGTHYLLNGTIKNDRPSIDTLTVGTDLNFSGSVETGTSEEFEYTGVFNARQLFYVDIDASDGGSIDDWEVRLQSDDSLLIPSSGNPETGAEYDISGETEGSTLALYALVTDNDEITTRYNFSMIIDNNDDADGPTGTLDPITVGSVIAGHIESAAESRDFSGTYDGSYTADATADVSGTISISGEVADDQRIDGIYLTISGYDPDGTDIVYTAGDEFAIAEWDDDEDWLEFNALLPAYGADEEMTSTFDPDTGHSVSFSFVWDSSEITGVTAEDVSISLRVADRGGAPDTDSLTVDVVPYVTSVDRNDSISQSRTKLGKYTLDDTAADVLVSGYNLDPETVQIYNSDGSDSTDLSATIDDIDAEFTSFTFDLSTEYSGWLWFENDADGAGAIPPVTAINNFNDNSLDQNRQDDGSGMATTLWNDDLYIDLWNTDNDFQTSNDAAHPALAVNSAGTQYAAWSNYTNSARRYGTDTQVNLAYGPGTVYDPPEWNDIAFNQTTNDFFIVNLWNQLAPTGGDGYQGLRIHTFEGAALADNTNTAEIDHLSGLFQYQNPRIAVKDAGGVITRIYISYYDATLGALKFARYSYNNGTNGLSADTDPGTGDDFLVVDDTDDVGEYSDIAIDAAGNPFIVYYDKTNHSLKLARATDDDPDTAGEWIISDISSGITFCGEYVSAAVDASGAVHISTYRNATGDLIYLTAPNVAGTFTAASIDTEGAVGVWSEIAIADGVPYISYIYSSQVGTFFGLKYAYWTGSEWEIGTIPVKVSVNSVRTGIAAKPAGATPTEDYVVSVGYSSGFYYFARLRPEQ